MLHIHSCIMDPYKSMPIFYMASRRECNDIQKHNMMPYGVPMTLEI